MTTITNPAPLTGSPKQIAWASDIREQAAEALGWVLDPNANTKAKDLAGKLIVEPRTAGMAQVALAVLLSIDSAKDLIEIRQELTSLRGGLSYMAVDFFGVRPEDARRVGHAIALALEAMLTSRPDLLPVAVAAGMPQAVADKAAARLG